MPRKTLSADGMTTMLRKRFEQIQGLGEARPESANADALLTAMSAFSFKFDSFKTFYELLENPREPLAKIIGRIYKIENVPSPTRIKEIVDPLESESLMVGFKDIFRELQRGKALEPYRFLGKYYLVGGDGSQYFESEKNPLQTVPGEDAQEWQEILFPSDVRRMYHSSGYEAGHTAGAGADSKRGR